MWRKENHPTWECTLVQPLWRTVWRLLRKLRTSTWSCNPTPGYISRQNYSKRYMHPCVHSSAVHNSQDMETIWCPSTDEWIKMWYIYTGTSLMAQSVKNLPTMQETWVRSLGQEDSLENGTATHSSILAWRIPWTEEPGRLQSMGSQKVRHNWANFHFLSFTYIYSRILLSHKKEQNNAICNSMDATRDYHTKWSKSKRERWILYDVTYMWNLKYDTNEPIHETNRITDIEYRRVVATGEVAGGERSGGLWLADVSCYI